MKVPNLITASVLSLFFCAAAKATLLDSISALGPGERYRVIFVTNAVIDSLSADAGIYNSIVAQEAVAGAVTSTVPGEWKAIVNTPTTSVNINIGQRFNDSSQVHFFNTRGELLGLSWATLYSGTLNAFAAMDANGALIGDFLNNPRVWTGINRSPGTAVGDRLGFGQNSTSGCPASLGPQWLVCFTESATPDNRHPLYGISALNTIAAVPEPSTVAFMILGLMTFSVFRRLKRVIRWR